MKKIAFKRIGVLVVAAIVLLAFALPLGGCHRARKVASFDLPLTFDENRIYEITFWAKNDSNITQKKIYQSAIDEFEKIYPNIKVTMKSYSDYGQIFNDVRTNIATRTTPDVCITYPDHIATYLTGENVVVPLEQLANDSRYGLGGSEVRFESVKREEIVDKFLKECYVGGSLYALPYMRSTEALYINKTYVEAMGYEIPDVPTWKWVWEVSEKALEKDPENPDLYKANGQNVMIPCIYKSTDNMMITMLKQKNAGYSDENGNIYIFNDTTRELLKEIAVHGKSRAFSTFGISSYPGNYFNAGKCLFAIDSTAGATWIGSKSPLSDIHESEIRIFETVVRPVPQFDTENPQMISQGPSLCLFNNGDNDRVLAAWLFMQFLLTNDVQIAYSKTEGYVPVTEKAHNDATYIEYLNSADENSSEFYSVKIDAAKLLLDNIGNSFITPVFDGSTALRSAAGNLIEYTVKGVRRGETMDDKGIDDIYEKLIKLHNLDLSEKKQSTGNTSQGGNPGFIGVFDPGRASSAQSSGPLPAESVALLVTLVSIWVVIGTGFLIHVILKKRLKKSR